MEQQWKDFMNSLYVSGCKEELEICEAGLNAANKTELRNYCLMLINKLSK